MTTTRSSNRLSLPLGRSGPPPCGPGPPGRRPWINQDGKPVGNYAHCLPPEYADANLLPGSHEAIELFRELGIPWHCGIDDGPGNHLLSRQVQCVNALMPMVARPRAHRPRLRRRRRHRRGARDRAGPLPHVRVHRPDRLLRRRCRQAAGPRAPAAPASTRRSSTAPAPARRELALVEWKYTESYRRPASRTRATTRPASSATARTTTSPAGPLRSELHRHRVDARRAVLPADAPAAARLAPRARPRRGRRRRPGPARAPAGQRGLPAVARAARAPRSGDTVDEVWATLLRTPDRFRARRPGGVPR